jgi:hypothetical protein
VKIAGVLQRYNNYRIYLKIVDIVSVPPSICRFVVFDLFLVMPAPEARKWRRAVKFDGIKSGVGCSSMAQRQCAGTLRIGGALLSIERRHEAASLPAT